MDVSSTKRDSESKTETFPLLMERPESLNSSEHIIDIPRSSVASPSTSHDRTSSGLEASPLENRSSTSVRTPISQPSTFSSNGPNTQNSSFVRRGEARRRRSPLNSGLWISVEMVLTISQIVASIVVLSVSRNEHPRAPLFEWIVGYASGCVATLPLLYWRYRQRSQVLGQDSAQPRQGSTHISVPAGPYSVSVSRNSEAVDHRTAVTSPRGGQNVGAVNARLKTLVEYFKMALDCFFAVWFVVGNVWIFGGHSSASEAPNMYRCCSVTFSLCSFNIHLRLERAQHHSCVLLLCREDLGQTRGATAESIDALPTYKFKENQNRNCDDGDSNWGAGDGGIVAAGTEQERVISGEDAVCCICLAKYANNDELRELPCSHFFHRECVDKWLKINASCPLCKSEVCESFMGSLSGSNSGQQRVEGRVGNGLASTMF
ncbi:E3 ubiquitin-protein ligase At1g63170 isoform X2 [Hevea brasiliensis]|uniref:E3 ubiquitin-protein ligase At1g63170 isoform X2 n=1 Tax=Hevea brasiliensis TaxID=3981 RepID=UPI0025EC7C43|nr:E3 ubiquitin-protein ligase At1g63170 isoform X2 [Hevea brasiliensis]